MYSLLKINVDDRKLIINYNFLEKKEESYLIKKFYMVI